MGIVRYTLDTLPEIREEDLVRMRAIKDEDINYSDIPPLTDDFWANARRLNELYRPQKRQVTVRIDTDVLAWLKSQGKGYQTRMNVILRAAMLHSLHRKD